MDKTPGHVCVHTCPGGHFGLQANFAATYCECEVILSLLLNRSMATKAGPRVGRQPYVDTFDVLSRQEVFEEITNL